MKSISSHFTRCLLVLGFAQLLATPVSAAWPDEQPVRIVVPQAAGGTNDTIARLISAELSRVLKQSVIVENRPGAAGAIGLQTVAKSKPDGYTLAIASDSSTLLDVVRPDSPVKFVRDFVPVAYIGDQPISVAVSERSLFRSMADVLKAGTARGASIPYGTSGVGTPQHVVGEWLGKLAGLNLVHIPYKGGGQAASDLVGGQIELAVLGLAPMLAQQRSGGVRIIAISTKARNPALPDVPTLTELGYPQIALSQWVGLVAPQGTPADVVGRLSDALVKVVAQANVQRLIQEAGVEPRPAGHVQFASFLRDNVATWAQVVPTLQLPKN